MALHANILVPNTGPIILANAASAVAIPFTLPTELLGAELEIWKKYYKYDIKYYCFKSLPEH